MQDMLAAGAAWFAQQARQNAATPVRYERRGISAVVPALFGSKLLRLDDGDGGIRYEYTDLELFIAAVDLVLAGEPITPERGDRVYVDGPDGTAIYEAFPYGGEPVWRWSDPHRQMVRIRTKFIEMEPYS